MVDDDSIYRCRVCGSAEHVAISAGEGRAICQQCCTEHDYKYVEHDRGYHCSQCFAEPPPDWVGYDMD